MSRFVKHFIYLIFNCLYSREELKSFMTPFLTARLTEAGYRFIISEASARLFLIPLLVFIATLFHTESNAATAIFHAEVKVENGDKWISMPTEELMKIGKGYLHETFMPDSALAVFSIITNRYSPKMTLPEKKEIVAAFNGLWETYMFGYFDYTEASRVLLRSFDVCEEAGLPVSRNYYNMGIMYQNMAEISSNSEILYKDAIEHYKEAFRAADKEGDAKLFVAVSSSLTVVAKILRDPSIVAEEINILKSRAHDMKLENIWRYHFATNLYYGLVALSKSDYKGAISYFKKMQKAIPEDDDPEVVRHLAYTLLCIADAEQQDGNLAESNRIRNETLALCRKYDIKDGVLQCLDTLAKQFERVDKEISLNYRNQYLTLKDSLLNYRQIASVKEMKIHQQLKDFDNQIADMKRKEERQILVITIVLIIVTATIMMLLIIYLKNRKLKSLNQVLYSKNLEYLKAEEQRRLLHKEREREATVNIGQEMEKPAEKESYSEDTEPSTSTKYKNSQLAKESKEEIMLKIMEVMEESEEIFQPGFSAANLSELTGVNYKYISQVINETHGCNFNVFLNEFRVKRACVLINSMSKSMPITIEGLANQVGFRSRNSFAVAFKKFTGLNPSEYIRAAKASQS